MGLSTKLIALKGMILDILFPPICLNCKTDLRGNEKLMRICIKCADSIIAYSAFFCPKCKARVPGEEKTCHKDIKFILAAAADYQNPAVKNLVKFFKYNKWKCLVKLMEPIICDYLVVLGYDFSGFTAVPIPLHPERRKERGFNQSELIAEIFCGHARAKLDFGNLKRVKETLVQAELKNAEERRENVKNCFALSNPEAIRNKNIVLVDDVFTTGSTIGEAAELLKKSGAKKIIAFVFAKA